MDNGYRFFAPDPGPSYLIRFEYLGEDGQLLATGRIPDLATQRPRLFYHRHLMLAAMVAQMAGPALELPQDVNPRQLMNQMEWKAFEEGQRRAKRLQQSIAHWLLSEHAQAHQVRLILQEHAIPPPYEIQRGMQLTDERLYRDRILGTFGRSQP